MFRTATQGVLLRMHVHLRIENPSAGRHETLSPEPQSW